MNKYKNNKEKKEKEKDIKTYLLSLFNELVAESLKASIMVSILRIIF